MKQLIEVIYIINGTTKTDHFRAESSSVNMLLEGTVIDMKGGTRIKIRGSEATWEPILGVMYRNAEVVYHYLTED